MKGRHDRMKSQNMLKLVRGNGDIMEVKKGFKL